MVAIGYMAGDDISKHGYLSYHPTYIKLGITVYRHDILDDM